MSTLLIVNADDYGLTHAVDRGILRAHRDGVVTSTSVLAVGPALARTAGWLTAHPDLEIGGHLALTGENRPLLTRAEIPTLVDRRGGFPLDYRGFLARAALGRVDPADIEREFSAQLESLTRGHDLPLSHLDTHEHVHLWPPVAAVVVALALRHGIDVVRLPTSNERGPKAAGVRLLSRWLAARLRKAGLVSTKGFGGLDESARLTLPRWLSMLDRLSDQGLGSIEICCHPGEPDPLTRARYAAWDFCWDQELAALLHPELPAAIERHGMRIGGHAALRKSGDVIHLGRMGRYGGTQPGESSSGSIATSRSLSMSARDVEAGNVVALGENSKKRVVVTGGRGFIGQAAAHALIKRGYTPVIYDVPDSDTRNGASIRTALEGAEAVIHLAGVLGTHELFDAVDLAIDINVKGAARVLEAVRDTGTRYVGLTLPGVFPSVYSATKGAAVALEKAFHHTYGIPVSRVLAFNAYGPAQKHGPGHPQKILPTFAAEAWAGRPIPIWGDGSQTVDLVHVDDLGELLVECLAFGDNFTIDGGTGIALTVNEVAEFCIKVTGSKAGIDYKPMRRGEVPTEIVATGQGWERIDWRPKHDWDRVAESIESYKYWNAAPPVAA